MRILYYLILILFCSSCLWKAYPDEKFIIDDSFRNLVIPYHLGDTLIFKSSKNEFDSFLITKIDSVIENKKGFFINARNQKRIFISYRQIPLDKWAHSRIEMGPDNTHETKISEDATLIDIIRFPDNETTELYFNFKIFYGCRITKIDPIHLDTLDINGLRFTSFNKIQYCDEDLKKPTDIKYVYSTISKGIIAYQYLDGTWWRRVN